MEIVDLPNLKMVIVHSYFKLPEGMVDILTSLIARWGYKPPNRAAGEHIRVKLP
jgi:hypothetical protein